ncbi:unnamed protein product [Porites lobata]|uniref:Uncharacterized protein n=1 Tax=Porites lobata TaxID=104759 RepID=A0ABN8PI01_9CNID|nr:unnamed protein product [Porites lobata]
MHDTVCNVKASELEMQDLVHMSDACKAESNHEIITHDACDKHSVQECKDCMDNLTAGGDKVRIKPQAKWHLLSRLELPDWLRGNPFLSHYHRPPMPSFGFCFKSIFKVHTETGNIWTHLIGFIAFVSIALYMFLRPISASSPFPKDWQENLDYAGIVVFIMGSFIPPLYYAFYCSRILKIVYMSLTCSLGVMCIIVSLWGKFKKSKYRIFRAGLLIAFGWSGVIPAVHLVSTHEATLVMRQVAVEWIILMSFLYTASAVTYATRIPERFFPGKCDIWFQSHQIFHVLVVIAAFVHFYGICQMAYYRFDQGSSCTN